MTSPRRVRHVIACAAIALSGQAACALQPAEIVVIDDANGWPVPLVQLRTTHDLLFVTDNAGIAAIDAPELLSRECWFEITGHGYGVPADGFGYRGVRLKLAPGERREVRVQRELAAQRLGRATGAGQFAESQQLGRETQWQESGVFGCDSVQMTPYREGLFWLWGDTDLPHYPLGIFNVSGAASPTVVRDDWHPPLRFGAQLDYFRNDRGVPRGIADIPGDGPTWLWGLIALPDEHGHERLCASYEKVKGSLRAYEKGLCAWDEVRERFVPQRKVWSRSRDDEHAPPLPTGHAVAWQDEQGQSWVLFGDPFPHLRCRATFAAWRDPASWELLDVQQHVAAAGDGRRVTPARGAIAYSDFRGRWVCVFCERLGDPSAFGELWYCEADEPTGPWGPAVKVVTHDNYTFYNPAIHAELTPEGSKSLVFEATYTHTFADHAAPTPRHDYNQIWYRLDLDDPRLAPAQKSR